MIRAKLYRTYEEELVGEVKCRFYKEDGSGWWGELVFTEYTKASDGDGYTLALEDGRWGRCSIKKKLNKAVSGIPPLFYYRFQGSGELKKIEQK